MDYHEGLSKRELFAAMAMQGYLSSYDVDHEPAAEALAMKAVAYADALIAALSREAG